VRLHPDSDRVVVTAIGELDIATAPLLMEVGVAAGRTPQCRAADVDLHAVTLLGCVGLAALIELQRDMTAHDRVFRIIGRTRGVDRLLALAHLNDTRDGAPVGNASARVSPGDRNSAASHIAAPRKALCGAALD
jgi:anti-anti-sigma factor